MTILKTMPRVMKVAEFGLLACIGLIVLTPTSRLVAAVTGDRPLLVILLEYRDRDFADSDFLADYRARIFGPATRTVTDYFSETSHGHFTYVAAAAGERYGTADGIVRVTMNVDQANAPTGSEFRRQALALANPSFDYRRYDTDDDGTLQDDELAVLVIQANGGASGKTARADAGTNDGVECGGLAVAVMSENAPTYVLYHELSHIVDLDGATGYDLYNLRDGLQQKTIMWRLAANGAITRAGSVGHEIALEADADWFASGGAVAAYRDQNGELSVANYDLSDADHPALKKVARAGLAGDLSVCQVSALRVLTALQSGGGNLKLIVWDVNLEWELTRRGDYTPEPASDIDVVAVSSSRAVAAFSNADGNLKLMVFGISAAGNLTLIDSYTTGGASEINVVKLSSSRVVVAIRLPNSGYLKLICFDIAQNGTLTRRGDYTAGSSRDIDLATVGAARVAASVRTNSETCKVILFEVSKDGELTRLGSHEDGAVVAREEGELQPVTSVGVAGVRVAFAYVDADRLLQVRALDVEPDGNLTLAGSASAGTVRSAKVIRITSDGSLFATLSRSDGQIWTGTGFGMLGGNTGSQAVHFDPYTKLKLGWLPYQTVICPGTYRLHPMGTADDEALIVRDPAHRATEYFIVEVRKRISDYEDGLEDEGLAIWHVDETKRYPEPFVSLEWLGGSRDTALWAATDTALTLYDDSSSPAGSRWSDFSASGIAISEVEAFSNGISFRLSKPPCAVATLQSGEHRQRSPRTKYVTFDWRPNDTSRGY